MELTEEQAKAEFEQLSDADLIALAESQGKPTSGFKREQLIRMLLGKCAECKGGNMQVVIISKRGSRTTQITEKNGAPCVGCGK